MEKSYQSPFLSGNTARNSPFSTSGKRSVVATPNSLSKKASIASRSRSNQQIIAKSNFQVVKNYGNALPVLVNEALTFSDRNVGVTVSFSNNEWAWAVSGRRLLIWEARTNSLEKVDFVKRRGGVAQCRELTLPQCDIGHKSTLISVFQNEGQQMASCLAVSPAGEVRYWPSIAHDGSSIDETIGWEGQEFYELLNISPVGYILSTTTCNLVLLQIHLNGGRHQIGHKNIKPPLGFFGGIGKKFASIVIGMHSSHDKENKLIKVCTDSITEKGKWLVSVLAEHFIQRWSFSQSGTEVFQYEDHDILRKIRDSFHAKLWPSHDVYGIDMWCLDMQQMNQNIMILVAAVNISHTPQIHYALITLSTGSDAFQIKNFQILTYNTFYNKAEESDLLGMRFVLTRSYAYVYNSNTIYPVLLNESASDDVEKLEFFSQGDQIMTGMVNNQNLPIFFSRNYGQVCVTALDFEPDLNSSVSSELFQSNRTIADSTVLNQSRLMSSLSMTQNINLSIYDLDPEEIRSEGEETGDQLKAAFIFHLKGQTNTSAAIINEIFPKANIQPENDTPLDLIVYEIAKDLAEDIPSTDPRWDNENTRRNHALGSSTSLQILQQLREKSLALTHFIDFLHASKLWERLTAITVKDNIRPTCRLLKDISEKIVAAIALKCAHNNYPKIMDMTIENVLEQRKEHPLGSLTPQDLFYVKVTHIQDFFRVMGDVLENILKNDIPTGSNCIVMDVNTIILTVLTEINRFRDAKGSLYEVEEVNRSREYLTWTMSSGKAGIRDVLLQMITLTLKYGIRGTGEPELKYKYYQQMVDLIDFVLEEKRKYLASIQGSDKYSVTLRQYESQRSDLIYPLIDDEQYELATKLAEKYHDFQSLVTVCDRSGNQEKLDEYIQRYKEYDFSQIAINWHLRQNKQADLFQRFKHNQLALGKFLIDHPSLAWMQLIFNGEMGKAAKTLTELALNEIDLVARKKTILSLAKLAYYTTGENKDEIDSINQELVLIDYQAGLKEELFKAFGFDKVNQRVLKAEEIIDLLISEENVDATEDDFRRALEILPYVDETVEIRNRIWYSAIYKDSWTTFDMNAPNRTLEKMLFFKLIECCYLLDGNLDLLPPIETFISAPELEPLIGKKSFQYLLKLGYEQLKHY